MESHAHNDEYHPGAGLPTVAEGEHEHNHGGGDEHHHEHGPKAVIKKVKAKAKKIKETLTGHGHGHEHHEGHTHAEHDDEEDEDEEMVEDPEVHGAPMYESSAIRAGIAGPQSGVKLEKPSSKVEDRYDPHITDPPTRPFGAWQEENSGHAPPSATPWTNSGQERMPMPQAAAADMPSATPWMNSGQHTSTATATTHGTYPSAHETPSYASHGRHVPATTTTHEPPLYATLGTNVAHEGVRQPTHGTNVAHEGVRQPTHGTNVAHESVRQPSSVRLGQSIPSSLDDDPNAPKDRPKPSNYESKVSDPTGTGEEAGITSLLHSMDKMRVHDQADRHQKRDDAREGFTGSHDQFSSETNQALKNYETTNPEDMPRDTSYTGKISSATSAITGKAVAAKNVVASKLGYGGDATTDQSSNTSSVSDYGHKIASSVTETLAPVYGKVAGVGSTVMSKVSGGGGSGSGAEGDNSGVGSTVGQEKGTDKGVSVKEFLVEKFKPGEEDKALSEVITHSLYKDKEVAKERNEEEKEKEKEMGKVTQSIEVTRTLGTGDEPQKKDGDGASANAGAAGQAVVDRVKGWFGMGSPNSQPSSGTLLAGKREGKTEG